MNKLKQSIFLFAGTAIGAGMLALPLTTGISGYLVSFLYILIWFFYARMTMFVLLECLGYDNDIKNAGFSSLAEKFSGRINKTIINISYGLLLGSVSIAYIMGGSQLMVSILHNFNIDVSIQIASIIFSLIFSIILIQRMTIIGIVNQVLMYSLIGSFAFMIWTLFTDFKLDHLLSYRDPYLILPSATIIILSFACHNILPTILTFLNGDHKKLKKSINYGMLLPLSIYLLWNGIILGILPLTGNNSLEEVLNNSHRSGELAALASALGNANSALLENLFTIFAISAILTSYIGVLLSLRDYIAQSLVKERSFFYDTLTLIIICVILQIIVILYPNSFSYVIGYAGLIIVYLFSLTPVIWALKARKKLKLISRYPSRYSDTTLILIGITSIVVIFMQIYQG